MLQLALRSTLPLVSVATTDLLNLPTILQHLAKRPPQRFTISKESFASIQDKALYYMVLGEGKALPEDLSQIYEKLVDKEATLVLVNLGKPHHLCFDAGVVPVPQALVRQTLEAVFQNKKVVSGLLPVLGGCTLKDVGELVRLTFARDQNCTPEGLMRTRQMSFRAQGGLTLVDQTNAFYQPPDFLRYWLLQEKPYFLGATDSRLIPRGLLFAGQPGTGKTAASKWLAKEMGVPLYRLDIGTTKSKFVGESERQLSQALAKLDQEEPCVVLLDEIEKAFSKDHGQGDSGTTTGLLSQLLWWLAEHRSRVLTVMTCNNQSIIPQELYRPGRIDEVYQFRGLTKLEDCTPFAEQVLGDFGLDANDFDLEAALIPRLKEATQEEPWKALSQAEIEVLTIGLIKNHQLLL